MGFGNREVPSQTLAVPAPAGGIFLSLVPCLPHEGSNIHVLSSEIQTRQSKPRATRGKAWDAFVEWVKKEVSTAWCVGSALC